MLNPSDGTLHEGSKEPPAQELENLENLAELARAGVKIFIISRSQLDTLEKHFEAAQFDGPLSLISAGGSYGMARLQDFDATDPAERSHETEIVNLWERTGAEKLYSTVKAIWESKSCCVPSRRCSVLLHSLVDAICTVSPRCGDYARI